ncbi:hypothetical protein FG05_35222 [Fusarium graminearum]|nr:hypothetical protein FG05_35222 [Fusarium graminearum]
MALETTLVIGTLWIKVAWTCTKKEERPVDAPGLETEIEYQGHEVTSTISLMAIWERLMVLIIYHEKREGKF